MKVLCTLYMLLVWQAYAIGQELPSPAANTMVMPQDSYVIAMDNTWQATAGPLPANRNFNLKAYGLVVYLLNNNIKVKRIIRAGKAKDGVDFSASCRQLKPVAELNPQVRDFKAGPFVVFGPDLLRVNIDQLIDNYNNNANGISGITHDSAKVKVYKTASDVTVDVRHDLTGFKPKAAILTDGGNAPIHLTYLNLAGVPLNNYSVEVNNDLAVSCFTFASEPHNDYQVSSVVDNIKSFVQAGGNFLAQCVTVAVYESLGKFQSTAGITVANATPLATHYPNADLSMAQFEGGFNINNGGSLKNWRYGISAFANGAHAYATNTNGFVNGTSLIGASGSKLTSSGLPGGMVFYLGNHSFSNINDYNHLNGMRMYLNALLTPANIKNILSYSFAADCNAGAMKVGSFNGPAQAYPVSFYLYEDKGAVMGAVDPGDAFVGAASVSAPGTQALISLAGSDPKAEYVINVVPSASCYKPEQVSPPPCSLVSLSAALKNFTAERSGAHVLLRWQTTAEQESEGFAVQKLVAGEWQQLGFVPSAATGGNSTALLQYQFVTGVPVEGAAQFRIAMQRSGKASSYSDIRQVLAATTEQSFSLYPNPSATGSVRLSFVDAGPHSVAVYDMAGRVLRSYKNISASSMDLGKLRSGVYLVFVTGAGGTALSQKLVVK